MKTEMDVTYAVVGFPDKDKQATLHKDGYKKYGNAMRLLRKNLPEMERIMIRKEVRYKDCYVETSAPIYMIEDNKEYTREYWMKWE